MANNQVDFTDPTKQIQMKSILPPVIQVPPVQDPPPVIFPVEPTLPPHWFWKLQNENDCCKCECCRTKAHNTEATRDLYKRRVIHPVDPKVKPSLGIVPVVNSPLPAILPNVTQTGGGANDIGGWFTYGGGYLLSHVKVVTIFWGSFWKTEPNKTLASNINNFFKFILKTSFMDMLSEYSAGGYSIGHGDFIGTWTDESEPPQVVHEFDPLRFWSQGDFRPRLSGWLEHAVSTIPNDTMVFIYLPPNVTSILFDLTSCLKFCGYHSFAPATFRPPIPGLPFAVVPYPCLATVPHQRSLCTYGSSILDGLTKVSSHELAEAITDPAGQGWQNNAEYDEIGDPPICNSSLARLGGYLIQPIWSNRLGACAISPLHKTVLQDKAIGAVAMANLNDSTMYLGWAGTDSAHTINVSLSQDLRLFQGKVQIPQSSSLDGAALAIGIGQITAAWTDLNDRNIKISISALFGSALRFRNTRSIGETSSHAPALAFGNGKFYLAWLADDPSKRLLVRSSIDGIVWGPTYVVKNMLGQIQSSDSSPSLSFLNGRLCLLWKGNGNNHLNIMQSNDGIVWYGQVYPNDGSNYHPAMTTMVSSKGIEWILAWPGLDSQQKINALKSTGPDPSGLATQLAQAGKSDYFDEAFTAVCLTTFRSGPVLGWTGTDGNQNINIMRLPP